MKETLAGGGLAGKSECEMLEKMAAEREREKKRSER